MPNTTAPKTPAALTLLALAALVSLGLAAAEVKLAIEDETEATCSELVAVERTEDRELMMLEADSVTAGLLCEPVRVVWLPPAAVGPPLVEPVGVPVMLM